MTMHALRGMNDVLPNEIGLWREIEEKARRIFGRYRYGEIRTPILEEMAVFTRTIGDTTNIVEKEMYVFQDRNDKWIALRPEGTASVVRAFIEHNQSAEDPVARYFYFGPMYRHERPQKGRYRQFHQLGAEVLGVASPRLDAEAINMLDLFFRELGLDQLTLEINSMGCPICRPKFQSAFLDYLLKNESGLCSDCKRRMDRNPLRVLDCKEEGCRKLADEGPSIQDHLCEVCEKDFDTVLETLGLLGTPYKVNQKIVRGLDYYLKTTFEYTSNTLGAQNAVAGGGRYDGLVRLMGGPNVPGFGFAVGLERLVEILKTTRSLAAPSSERHGVFIAALGEHALSESMKLSKTLREGGVEVEMDYEGKSLKSQMRRADKTASRYVILLGQDELSKNKAPVRDLVSGVQEEVPLPTLADYLKKLESGNLT